MISPVAGLLTVTGNLLLTWSHPTKLFQYLEAVTARPFLMPERG
jgi:hypothetical protein